MALPIPAALKRQTLTGRTALSYCVAEFPNRRSSPLALWALGAGLIFLATLAAVAAHLSSG